MLKQRMAKIPAVSHFQEEDMLDRKRIMHHRIQQGTTKDHGHIVQPHNYYKIWLLETQDKILMDLNHLGIPISQTNLRR